MWSGQDYIITQLHYMDRGQYILAQKEIKMGEWSKKGKEIRKKYVEIVKPYLCKHLELNQQIVQRKNRKTYILKYVKHK